MANIKTGDILDYSYTGAVQTITLPKGIYKLECWGAQGGYRSNSSYGGHGGYSAGTITLKKLLRYMYTLVVLVTLAVRQVALMAVVNATPIMVVAVLLIFALTKTVYMLVLL